MGDGTVEQKWRNTDERKFKPGQMAPEDSWARDLLQRSDLKPAEVDKLKIERFYITRSSAMLANMRMMTDYQVGSLFNSGLGKLNLELIWLLRIFYTRM